MLTIPNIISIFRLLLIAPFGYCVLEGYHNWAIILGALSGVSDILDGYIARKLGQISEFGKIIDPIADKLMLATAAITLAMIGAIPIWFLTIALARDIIILAGGLFVKSRKGITLQANRFGKYTVFAIYIYLLFVFLDLEPFESIFLYISTLGLLISFISYLINAIKTISK